MIHIEASKAIFRIADKETDELKALLIEDGVNHLVKSINSTSVTDSVREQATKDIVIRLPLCSTNYRKKMKNMLSQHSVPPPLDSKKLAPQPSSSTKKEQEEDRMTPKDCIVKKWKHYEWSSLILPQELKTEIRNATVLPLKYHANKLPGVTPGILFYGSPGVGKTSLMYCIQTECPDVTVVKVSVSEICQKYYGDSEGFVASLFQLCKKLAPSLLFLDEIDGLMRKRTSDSSDVSFRVKSAILNNMDTNYEGVTVIGSTNFPNVCNLLFLVPCQSRTLSTLFYCRYSMKLYLDGFNPNSGFHYLESKADF